jgi:hypothetical protein
MTKARKLYSSPNRDWWYLIRDASGEISSGTKPTWPQGAMLPISRSGHS